MCSKKRTTKQEAARWEVFACWWSWWTEVKSSQNDCHDQAGLNIQLSHCSLQYVHWHDTLCECNGVCYNYRKERLRVITRRWRSYVVGTPALSRSLNVLLHRLRNHSSISRCRWVVDTLMGDVSVVLWQPVMKHSVFMINWKIPTEVMRSERLWSSFASDGNTHHLVKSFC